MQEAMGEERARGSGKRLRRIFAAAFFVLLTIAGGVLAIMYLFADSRRRLQVQTDPKVATVWVIGTTFGAQQTFTRGTPLQKWLNSKGIYAFGRYLTLGSTMNGDPGGVQMWFDYESYLPLEKNLECHRVGQTAFMDDLGQPYHGFLNLQGHYIGVYVPGYDHAAHKLIGTFRWMPRPPQPRFPISRPMQFTIDLPPVKRVLPPADSLPHGPITVEQQGIRITVSQARLSAAHLGTYRTAQRDLTFRLRIEGGYVCDDNAIQYNGHFGRPLIVKVRRSSSVIFAVRQPSSGLFGGPQPVSSFVITDPYGISLIPKDELLMPLEGTDFDSPKEKDGTIVWMAPVNNAGKGTDAVHLHFDVLPSNAPAGTPAVPFNVTIPVQTGDEV